MKIAVLGDTHLGASLYQYDLTPHIMEVMEDFYSFCLTHKVNFAVQLGDLFDNPRPSLELEQLALQWCNKFEFAGIDLHLLAGNHDAVASTQVKTGLSSIKAAPFRHVHVHDTPTPFYLPEAVTGVLLLPFPSAGIYATQEQWKKDVAAAFKKMKGSKFMVFSHLNVVGAKLGDQDWLYRGGAFSFPSDLAQHSRLLAAFNGHIHKAQEVGRISNVGAAQRLTFGEAHNTVSFTLLDLMFGCLDVQNFQDIPPVLELKQLDLDLTLPAFEDGLSAAQMKPLLQALDLQNKLVKVNMVVDDSTTITAEQITEIIYGLQALHVVCTPPIWGKQKGALKHTSSVVSADPLKLGASWIRERVSKKEEQEAVFHLFSQLHRKVSQLGSDK